MEDVIIIEHKGISYIQIIEPSDSCRDCVFAIDVDEMENACKEVNFKYHEGQCNYRSYRKLPLSQILSKL